MHRRDFTSALRVDCLTIVPFWQLGIWCKLVVILTTHCCTSNNNCDDNGEKKEKTNSRNQAESP